VPDAALDLHQGRDATDGGKLRRQPEEARMACNVGGMDKWLRIVAGVALLALGVFGPLGWWGAVGLVPLVTGLFGNCPVYSLLGLNTCPLDKRAA
jgi:hypothetical protein